MKIGFDISQISSGAAGCGNFAKSLASALLNETSLKELVLFSDFGDFWFNEDKDKPPYSHDLRIRYGPIFQDREKCADFWNNPYLDEKLAELDLVHSNNFWCPNREIGPRFVYTLYDLGFMDHPEWTTEENRCGCFEGVYRSSLYADFVVAISEFSRNKYLEYFPHFPKERISVVYPTSRFEINVKSENRPIGLEGIGPKGFWLCVSTIEPRKNQTRLLDAYRGYLEESQAKLPLVFAGGSGWLMDHFAGEIKKRGLENKVVVTGYVSDSELVWLYRNCFANLYPALYEGFGLPVLEGMQFGAPTVCSNTTSLPEVAGEGAIQLDPLETRNWSKTMIMLEENEKERKRLIENGIQQAGKFSASRNAGACLKLYEKALAMKKRGTRGRGQLSADKK